MFEKMVESGPAGRDFKDRRRYFVVSTLLVGVLFTTAVVISIFAADYGLGSSHFELVEMIAPVAPEPVTPERPEPQPRTSAASSSSELPTRQINMARVEEGLTIIPDGVSTTRNTQMARPDSGRFALGVSDTNPVGPGGSGRDTTGTGPVGLASAEEKGRTTADFEEEETTPPPPVKKPQAPKAPVSKGPLNGSALQLPKPTYTATAKAVGAQGQVAVQVVIDETGRVISANAVSGHLMLRAESERAARAAKFSPTTLSGVPVKVTGIITYNFTR